MKNYEKYKDEIKNYNDDTFCSEFVKPHILGRDSCNGLVCSKCNMLQMIWLLGDYKEPEIDWSKVKVDTPILVKHRLDGEWEKRHFAEYKNGDVYAWDNGRTSWTVANEIKWNYAKRIESEE